LQDLILIQENQFKSYDLILKNLKLINPLLKIY